MVFEKFSLLVVSNSSPVGGSGSLKVLKSLKEYVRYFGIYLVIPGFM